MIEIDPNAAIHTLLRVDLPPMSAAERERHEIFTLVNLALVFDNWCIQRDKAEVVAAYEEAAPGRRFSDYVGHNIGALLVSERHEVVAASLNSNYLHNDSTEHAEARLVRKGMRLFNRLAYRSGAGLYGYSSQLRGHTIYTSLESCSQCSGIMDLANLREVVYAQVDPGQGHIGNVLYNFHRDERDYGAPLPIKADFLPIFTVIADAFAAYGESLAGPDLTSRRRPSTTGFLRSVFAYRAYEEAARRLDGYAAAAAENVEVLAGARTFRDRFVIERRDAAFGP